MMKMLRAAICAVLLALLLAPCAAAAAVPLRTVTCAADARGEPVSLQAVDGEYYLFLPSTADLTALTFYFEGGPAVLTAAGRELIISSGQPFDLTALCPEASGGVRAFTFRSGFAQLPVKLMVSEGIAVMYITSADPVSKGRSYVEQVKGNKASGQMTLIGADGGLIYSGGLTQIKGRGNSTWNYPKKPYQIKLGKKTDLLETGDPDEAAKTWVLLANYYDKSFMLNTLTFDLADALGLAYSPNSRPVDLYYDGEYRGTYLLSEKTEVNGGRVDIHDLEGDFEDANPEVEDFDDLPTATGVNAYGNECQYVTGLTDPEDLSGGYLLEMDYISRAMTEKSYFTTTNSRGIAIVSKSPEYLSRNAMEYISGLYQQFEDAIWNGGVHPTTGKSYTDYVDLESLVRCYLILELSQDGDAFFSSTFFYKPEGEDKLYAGPVWDFDSAYGGHYANFDVTEVVAGSTQIGRRLLEIPSFCEAAEEIYENELNRLVTDVILSTDPRAQSGRLRSIPGYREEVAASQRMNNILWSVGGPEVLTDAAAGLRDFIRQRNTYLYEHDFSKLVKMLTWFTDVPEDAWYYSAVDYVVEQGLFIGNGGRLFNPGGTMTRAAAAAVLYRQAGSPGVENHLSFRDVPRDLWCARAVEWAAGAGVIEGYPDGMFYPDEEITRQELVTMLYRYAEYSGADVTAPELRDEYHDRDSVADWAEDAFAWAVDRGLVSGTSSGRLSPDGNALRCAAAVIFQRYNEMLNDVKDPPDGAPGDLA